MRLQRDAAKRRAPEACRSANKMSAFDTQNDFQLCNNIFCLFAEKNNIVDVNTYDEIERTITLVWLSHGLIGNGGFRHLFEGEYNGDSGFIYTIASYKKIGAQHAYDACVLAVHNFPNGIIPLDINERNVAINALPANTWDQANSNYYAAQRDTETCLARFIREHRKEMTTLLKGKIAEHAPPAGRGEAPRP